MRELSLTEDLAASNAAVPLLSVLRERNVLESYLKSRRAERDTDLMAEMTDKIKQIEDFETSYKVVSPEYQTMRDLQERQGVGVDISKH